MTLGKDGWPTDESVIAQRDAEIAALKQAIARQKESLQDHIDTNIELRARVRELEDRMRKEGIDP